MTPFINAHDPVGPPGSAAGLRHSARARLQVFTIMRHALDDGDPAVAGVPHQHRGNPARFADPGLNGHLPRQDVDPVARHGRSACIRAARVRATTTCHRAAGRTRADLRADPTRCHQGEISTNNDGGRGVYGEDPSGHFLKIITRLRQGKLTPRYVLTCRGEWKRTHSGERNTGRELST